MMRLPRGGRAGRGPADQDVDGAHPSSYQVTWGLDRRRCVAGRPGRGQDRDQGRPPGPPVKFRVTRPRRTGTYILHVQICCKDPDRVGRREENRWYSALFFAVDPGPERLCNRFGQVPVRASPKSPCVSAGSHPVRLGDDGGGKWRSGRIVPAPTRRRRRKNRGIMRKPPSASGAVVRTILPERHFSPPAPGKAGERPPRRAPGPVPAERGRIRCSRARPPPVIDEIAGLGGLSARGRSGRGRCPRPARSRRS